jgi:hypothetical protein
MSALSCLVRGHDALAMKLLCAPHGPTMLRHAVAGPPRLAARTLHLVRCLLQQRRDAAELVMSGPFFDTLLATLVGAGDEVWEQALATLSKSCVLLS